MAIYKKLRFGLKDYDISDAKGYPIDTFISNKVKRLRTQLANMRRTIKEYKERIIIKENYLDDIFKDLKDKMKLWQKQKK